MVRSGVRVIGGAGSCTAPPLGPFGARTIKYAVNYSSINSSLCTTVSCNRNEMCDKDNTHSRCEE